MRPRPALGHRVSVPAGPRVSLCPPSRPHPAPPPRVPPRPRCSRLALCVHWVPAGSRRPSNRVTEDNLRSCGQGLGGRQGWKPRLSQLQSQEGLGEGAPLNQTGGWSWERGTASCAPQQGRDLTRLPVDCLQSTLVCPPGSRGRREPRSGFSGRLAPQDTGGEPGRGCSRKVGPQHRPWSVLCRGRGWGPGVRGRGTRACIGAVALGSPLPSLLPPLCIGENHQTSCSVGREEACEAFRRSPTHQKVPESGRQSQPAPRRAPDQPRAACGSWGRLLDRSPSLR